MSDRSQRTIELQIEVEKSCPLKCLHCSSVSLLNLNECGYSNVELMNFVKGFDGPLKISVTGGEPLNRIDIVDFLSCLWSCKPDLEIEVFSSGVLLKNGLPSFISEDYALSLKGAGVRSFYLTMFHSDSSEHDKMTDCRGSLEISKKSIENLIIAGIEVKVHLILNRFNFGCIYDVIYDLSNLGIKEVRLLKLVKHGRATTNWERIGVSDDEQERLIADLFKSQDKFPLRMTFSGFPEMTPCRPFEWAKGCQAGTRLFFVDFNGDIFPCACTRGNLEFRIGNISEAITCFRLWLQNPEGFRAYCLNSSGPK